MTSSPAHSNASSRVKTYSSLEVIAEEGSPGIGWYVLLSGRVGVFKGETQIAEFASRGVVFGEISSILRQPRTARLVALEPTSAMHFDADLDELIAQHPEVTKTMLVCLAKRLATTTDALWSTREEPKKTP